MCVNKCRLCFSESNKFVLIFDDNLFQKECRIEKIIAKYLHIELQIEDAISNKICNDCWKHLDDFNKFYLLIEEKQQMLDTKIPSIKCEFYQDVTIVETSHFEEDFKNISLCEQPIDVFSDEQPLSEDHEFETALTEKIDGYDAHLSTDKTSTISEVDSNEQKETSNQIKRSTRLRAQNLQCTSKVKIQKSNKSSINSHSGAVMREHDAYIAENVTLSCCICGQKLKDFGELKKHFRKEHKCRGYIICCNNKYSKRTPYVDHLKLHNNPELFKCDKCDKVLANRNSYQNHMFSCHPSEESLIFGCSICTKKFAKQYILDYHMASHRKEKKHSCDLCEKSFCSNAVLKEHQKRVHFSTMKIICDSCGKSFKCKQSFQIHHQNVHQDVKLPEVQCQICGRWLKDERSLYKHMYKHRDESSGKTFVCTKCGAVKSTKQTLRSHIRYHHPDKLQKCTLCEKEFKRVLALEEHMATHTGQTLYTCSFCPKTFKSHANMHNHKKKAHPNDWVRKYSQPSRIEGESNNTITNT